MKIDDLKRVTDLNQQLNTLKKALHHLETAKEPPDVKVKLEGHEFQLLSDDLAAALECQRERVVKELKTLGVKVAKEAR